MAGFNTNSKKSIVFPYNNEQMEIEILKNMLTIAQKNEIHINLTKWIQNLYAEKHKIRMKDIEEDVNKWRGVACL